MIENNIINDEDLEKVSGGTVTKNYFYYSDYNIPVGKYSGVIGTKYLFKGTSGSAKDWIFGTLVNTYESFWYCERIHDVNVEDGEYAYKRFDVKVSEAPLDYGSNLEIRGDYYQMYGKG